VAGDITGTMTYFGPCHLFHRDGVYVGQVFRDGRLGGLGADIGQPEGQGGALVRVVTHPGQPARTLVLAGGGDGRVTEILGLDTIRSLPTQPFVLTADQVALAAAARTAPASAVISNVVIVAGRAALSNAAPAVKVLDPARRFAVRAAHDDGKLIIRYEVTAPHELVNAVTDPQLVFKGGNCLDLQFQTPTGPVRWLITRQNGKPFAVSYRPKVPGFTGEPITLISPTGQESFDEIRVVAPVAFEYQPTATGFQAEVTLSAAALGLELKRGARLTLDFGYLYGNAPGTQVAARSYLFNNSFSANVVNDIPNESRLEPQFWGTAVLE
jgi:hypothetical protein